MWEIIAQFVAFLKLLWPSLALLTGGFLAQKFVPRLGVFKEMLQTIQAKKTENITISKYVGQFRNFDSNGNSNASLQSFHKALQIEQRLRTELDDLFRTCFCWVGVNASILLMMAGSLEKATQDSPGGAKLTGLDSLALLVSTPLAEILVVVFCFLSLQRLAKEWHDVKEKLVH